MKHPRYLLLFFTCCSFFSTAAQQRFQFIGMEVGGEFFAAEISNTERLRGGWMSSGYDADEGGHLRSHFDRVYVGLTYEFSSKNNKLAFSSGVRYSQMSAVISQRFWNKIYTPYFFYVFRVDGTDTEFLTLKSMTQETDYLGIPFSVRYFPFNGKRARFYVKAGSEITFKVASKNSVSFYEPLMEMHEDEVVSHYHEPDAVKMFAYLAGGLRIGREGKRIFGFEVTAPSGLIYGGDSGITSPSVGAGFQFYFAIPVNAPKYE